MPQYISIGGYSGCPLSHASTNSGSITRVSLRMGRSVEDIDFTYSTVRINVNTSTSVVVVVGDLGEFGFNLQ